MPTVYGRPLSGTDNTLFDGHAHAWIDPPAGVAAEHALRLDDAESQAAALEGWAKAASGWLGERALPAHWYAGLLDCQPPFTGRDANHLAALSRRSGVAVACVTGFHLTRYYPEGRRPWSSAEAASELFVAEFKSGLLEAPERRAAAIKAAHSGRVTDDLEAWEAVVEAQRRTGAVLLIHTERGAGAEDLLAWLLQREVPPACIYLCHVDKRPDLGLHLELARAGALLGYDTFVRPKYQPGTGVWPLLRALVEEGLGASVAVCLDLAPPEMWRQPEAGPLGFMSVAQRLEDELGSGPLPGKLLGGNVIGRLARPALRGMTA